MYRCGLCTKCFKFERNLINHQPTHGNDGSDSNPESFDGAVARGQREDGRVTPPTIVSPTAAAATSTARRTSNDDADALLSLAASQSRRPE